MSSRIFSGCAVRAPPCPLTRRFCTSHVVPLCPRTVFRYLFDTPVLPSCAASTAGRAGRAANSRAAAGHTRLCVSPILKRERLGDGSLPKAPPILTHSADYVEINGTASSTSRTPIAWIRVARSRRTSAESPTVAAGYREERMVATSRRPLCAASRKRHSRPRPIFLQAQPAELPPSQAESACAVIAPS
jgi:hypothetical protein